MIDKDDYHTNPKTREKRRFGLDELLIRLDNLTYLRDRVENEFNYIQKYFCMPYIRDNYDCLQKEAPWFPLANYLEAYNKGFEKYKK